MLFGSNEKEKRRRGLSPPVVSRRQSSDSSSLTHHEYRRSRSFERSNSFKLEKKPTLTLRVRRSWLRFQSSQSKSKLIMAVAFVFCLGILGGIMEPNDHARRFQPHYVPHSSPEPLIRRPSPPASSTGQAALFQSSSSMYSKVKNTLKLKPLSEIKLVADVLPKPVMVELPQMKEDGSDLSIVKRVNIREHEMPEIQEEQEDESDNPLAHVRYKERSRPRAGCRYLGEWQQSHHPTCLNFHELPLNSLIMEQHILLSNKDQIRLVNNGAYRDVWMVREYNGTPRALKTLRYISKRDFDPRNHERHRKDAVALEQLSSSPHVADIYGYCGNSALADYSTGGDLYDFIEQEEPKPVDRLRVAHVVAQSIADAHNLDSQGRATIAHTDIKPNQWIKIDDKYQLNDFNRARLLTWNDETDKQCGFKVAKNAGMWRSPEEYKYHYETEKVDVYSMGNVLYYLLMNQVPFEDGGAKDAVKAGKRPKIDKQFLKSDDPYFVAMIKAIKLCWEQDPTKRTGAKAVAELLKEALDDIEEEYKDEEEGNGGDENQEDEAEEEDPDQDLEEVNSNEEDPEDEELPEDKE